MQGRSLGHPCNVTGASHSCCCVHHADRSMRVAVLGASGATGRHAVHQALERGWSVTAVVRNPDSIKDLHHDSLKVYAYMSRRWDWEIREDPFHRSPIQI